jgi:hypothetical protein
MDLLPTHSAAKPTLMIHTKASTCWATPTLLPSTGKPMQDGQDAATCRKPIRRLEVTICGCGTMMQEITELIIQAAVAMKEPTELRGISPHAGLLGKG